MSSSEHVTAGPNDGNSVFSPEHIIKQSPTTATNKADASVHSQQDLVIRDGILNIGSRDTGMEEKASDKLPEQDHTRATSDEAAHNASSDRQASISG